MARSARVAIGPDQLVIGEKLASAAQYLDCAKSSVQHTIRKCTLKPAWIQAASSVGLRIEEATLNIHFQGDVINMAVEYGASFDAVFNAYKAALPGTPKITYWADDGHLYASYIWIAGNTEVEITKTVKGSPGDGRTRVYIASISVERPLSPEDAP